MSPEEIRTVFEFRCQHDGCGQVDRRIRNRRGPMAQVCDGCLERSKKLKSNPSHIWPTNCAECNRRRYMRSSPSGGNSSKADPSSYVRASAVAPNEIAEDRYGVFRYGSRLTAMAKTAVPSSRPPSFPKKLERELRTESGVTRKEKSLLSHIHQMRKESARNS